MVARQRANRPARGCFDFRAALSIAYSRSSASPATSQELAALDDSAFREVFSGSPIKRIGRNRFTRNVLTAIGNSVDANLIETSVLPHLDDLDPTVRGAAIWALSRLDLALFEAEKAARFNQETDESVRDEWLMHTQKDA